MLSLAIPELADLSVLTSDGKPVAGALVAVHHVDSSRIRVGHRPPGMEDHAAGARGSLEQRPGARTAGCRYGLRDPRARQLPAR